MKKIALIALSSLLLLVSGCASKSYYVDANDTTAAVQNRNSISSADWIVVVQEAAENLLTSPLFAEYLEAYKIDAEATAKAAIAAGEQLTTREKISMTKPLLMLAVVENYTPEHLDTTLLTNRIREVLFNSGKVRFTTYAAGEGQTIDTATAAARDLRYDPNVNKRTVAKTGKVNAYDLSLSGRITKQQAASGRMREMSYTFNLVLTDTTTGEGVWTYTKELKRQHRKAGLGW